MAQKIIFTFNNISGFGSNNFNIKLNSSSNNYFNRDILISEFVGPTSSNVVNVGSSINDFARNFHDVLRSMMPPFDINTNAFYNKLTINSNVVELISGSNYTIDSFLLNDVVLSGLINSFGSFGNISVRGYTNNSILLSWSGATDDNDAIVGYELQYRVGPSLFWQTPIFISSTYSGGVYELPVVGRRDYSFRIRTKDSSGQYSDYRLLPANITTNDVDYLRSTIGGFWNICPYITSIPIYFSLPLSQVNFYPVVAYNDFTRTEIFDGDDSNWTISKNDGSKYGVFIDTLGNVTNLGNCSITVANNSYRSLNSVSLSGTMCYVLCVEPVYYIQSSISIGITLYINVECNVPLYGGNSNYLIDDIYVCQISINGVITNIRYKSEYCTINDGGGNNGGGGGCLLGTTEILLSNDDVKDISDVVIGDDVLTYNFNKSENEIGKVVGRYKVYKDDIIKISLSNNTYIECTTSHPFWCSSKNSWVSLDTKRTLEKMDLDISQLEINDVLVDSNGYDINVSNISDFGYSKSIVYDIQVEPNNNYYANNILVHNKIVPIDDTPQP